MNKRKSLKKTEKSFQKPDAAKMIALKHLVMFSSLKASECAEMIGCDFEFTVKVDRITLLEIWFNPNGQHDYKDEFRREFKMDVPVNVIF